ncbi:MAG: ABC transporter [Planctomycetes bacterium GWF2_42_9]|nr:MAG: ABC transporter [Planctomycetes bacterium GWF2_42_9]
MKTAEDRLKGHPGLRTRIGAVWNRHVRVYGKNILSNGLPPFFEPLIFLGGVGIGLGKYIAEMDGLPYIEFLGSALLVTTAMFTSAFECSYGTFIRLEFDKVYDGMLAAPITVKNLLIGEILWAGTKGLFFSFAVLCILAAFGIIHLPRALLAPLAGFITGLMFGSLSLLVTSYVKTINHFTFYFTGLLSPMFFFSGVVFPITDLPKSLQITAEFVPLTHSVRLVRAIIVPGHGGGWEWSLAYIIVFTAVTGYFAIKRLSRRLIS